MTQAPTQTRAPAPDRGRVLAVDDNRLNRLTMEKTLQLEGHDVTLADNGERALELLQAQPFDAVLLDILMPGMDGYAVLERMKGDPNLRDIPVIVISALDDIDSAVRCIEMGAEDYLPKPFNAVLLRARLGASLQRKRLRDMERAYLKQEVTLRQNERLAMLGRMSAGMAHEMNNPAAAAQRGAEQLADALSDLEGAFRGIGALPPDAARDALLERLSKDSAEAIRGTDAPDALELADRIAAIETLLESAGVDHAWEAAPVLAEAGYTEEQLAELVRSLPAGHVEPVLAWLSSAAQSRALLDEIVTGTGRVAELVTALKGYTYLDQAPLQDVNVHEGLDSTLVILRSKLKQGIRVQRDFADDLPRIPAYGSELNQVWTNLVDNAIDAMEGEGELRIATRAEDDWVVVSVEDSGAGIPTEVQARLFDPFFTTKPPGSGTGLGLNISHAIVVDKHRGRIEVDSEPGRTRFDVWLPRERDDTTGPEHSVAPNAPYATGEAGAAPTHGGRQHDETHDPHSR